MTSAKRVRLAAALGLVLLGCSPPFSTTTPAASAPVSGSDAPVRTTTLPTPAASARTIHRGNAAVAVGAPIELADLSGRIVFDDFEDVYAMDVDGSNVVKVASDPAGSEFDGGWSPDGAWVVYRDSTRGMNVDDEIFIAAADGSERRNLTNDPANDWGPDWSPDGTTIVFNSDRGGGAIRGWYVAPDGSDLRPVGVDAWFEYPSWSPDGTRIVFEGATGATYDIFTLDIATGGVTRLTTAPGDDSWPVWSPDGSLIAFSSERDDCDLAPADQECWDDGEPNDYHHAIWVMAPDGSGQRRVTSELGQFVAWSPDGNYLLISGQALFVVRPDGTGRLELRAQGREHALGGIPDWR